MSQVDLRFRDNQFARRFGNAYAGAADKCIGLVLFLAACVLPTGASAQDEQSISVGETRVIPALRLDYVSIDNLFRKNMDPVSATGVLVRPELAWQADRRLLFLEASYKGDYGFFSREEAEYTDHVFQLRALGDLSSRHRVSSSLNINLGHEEQGTGQTRGLAEIQPEQIEFSVVDARLLFTYGAREAKGNLSGGLTFGAVGYSNLDQFTEGDDYTFVRPSATFSYRISPDTRLLASVRFTTLDFDDDSRDRTEVSFLTGVELSPSAKLSGDVRVGVLKASFDELSSADTTELVAEVGVNYELSSFSSLNFSFDREFQTVDASDSNAGRSIEDDASLDWTYEWSSRFETVASVGLLNTDRECPSVDDRTGSGGLEFNYNVRRWLQMGLSGRQVSRVVTACDDAAGEQNVQDYDRTELGFHVRGTL